jgi:hypothetical protein
MADGCIVKVTTSRMGGGSPMVEIWYAHIPDHEVAVEAVRKAAGATADTDVKVVKPVRHDVLVELAVPENGVKRYDGTPS